MSEIILHIEHLHKTLGRKHILKDISFDTYAGEVFGFLGPNGAGKTTLIKIATGLLTLDEGEISICGISMRKDYEGAMANVGGIVENPEFYKYMSGLENLRQYARMREGITEERIREVVHLVGLDNRIHDKVGKYSLGMRQRLGVAQAILHHPKLLILDEPTNGLDPAGIKDLRDILKTLAHREGVGVMVSSHLMSEMEMMCDRVGVIVNGELNSVHTIDELTAVVNGDHSVYLLHASPAHEVKPLLEGMEGVEVAETDQPEVFRLTVRGADSAIAEINKALIEAGASLYTVEKQETRRLEDAFIELTKEGGDQIA